MSGASVFVLDGLSDGLIVLLRWRCWHATMLGLPNCKQTDGNFLVELQIFQSEILQTSAEFKQDGFNNRVIII